MPARRRALKPCGERRERRLPTNATLPEATHDIYARVNCDMSSGGVLGFLKRLRYRMHNATGLYMLNKFERWCLCKYSDVNVCLNCSKDHLSH